MVYLGGFCLLVSMVGLYILLISSFSPGESQQIKGEFIQKAARKIRIHKDKSLEKNNSVRAKPNPQFILLVESIIIGEAVGLFFLTLSGNPLKFKFLALNSAVLLIASFLCSVLTLFNTWLRKKTHLVFRVILQATTLIIGIILFKFAMADKSTFESVSIVKAGYYIQMAIYGYFITVVVAIGTMLYVAIKGSPEKLQEFEFGNYLILVIMSGLLIGSGLLLIYSIRFINF